MEAAELALAGAGVLAVVWGVLKSLVRLLQRGAEAVLAGELERSRAGRGDVTGATEAAREGAAARRARGRAAGVALAWAAALLAPGLTPWARSVYAACSLLWLLHLKEARR